jgi:excinuclease ABC subunit C
VPEWPDSIRQVLDRLPDAPGCYRYFDAAGELLYVGKAVSLRSRVRSYFQPSAQHPPKTRAMLNELTRIDFIEVGSEVEALILESNLIKEHKPRFNILLRDDKSFPYLKLTTQDPFPRVNLVRRPRPDGSAFYGPFLPASHAWRTLRMLPKFFQVANCRVPFDGKQRPCLYYHLDQCLAPCAGKADPVEYADRVGEARLFLEGRHDELESVIRQRMQRCSEQQDYERAAHYRDMLRSLSYLAEKQGMITLGEVAIDFWAEYRERDRAALEVFQMRAGKVINRREFTFPEAPPVEQFYDQLVPQFYAQEIPPPEIVLPRAPNDRELLEAYLRQRSNAAVSIRSAVQGERRRFLDIVATNAQHAFEARFRQGHNFGVEVLDQLRDLVGLDEAPYRIEGFDISHTQGVDTRASLVVFEAGRPQKSEYRLYVLRGIEPGDDYAALRQAVGRRLRRLKQSGKRLPDLMLIDGGAGQLAAAHEAAVAVGCDQPMIAIAKRFEELYFVGRSEPLRLERSDPLLFLLQQIRDESHRFANTKHRQARGKSMRRSRLHQIPGVGAIIARRLLSQFGSVEGVLAASFEALRAAVGPARAEKIHGALHPAGDQVDLVDGPN